MTLSNRVYGQPGDEFSIRATQKDMRLGTIMEMSNGDEFVYLKNGAVELAVGRLVQQAAVTSGHGVDVAVAVAAAVGATSVTITNKTTAITKDMYADGTLFVNDEAGEGYHYRIKSHPAEATLTGTCVITLYEQTPIQVALTVASQVGLRKNKYQDVIVAPTAFTGIIVGATVRVVTAAYYFWAKKLGDAVMLTNGTVILGKAFTRSGAVAGAIDVYPLNSVDASGQEPMLGTVQSVGATGEYSLCYLNIQ